MAVSLTKSPSLAAQARAAAEALFPVTKLPTGATSGITKRQWDRRVRGESEPVEVPSAPRIMGTLKIRAGFGAVR